MPSRIIESIFSRKNAFGTTLFILINILFYFYLCFQSGFSLQKLIQGPGYDTLVLFGAKENGLISLGQIHRFFFPSSCRQIYSTLS